MIPRSRLVDAFFALLLLVIGFAWLGHAERTLWLQAPPSSLDRFAVDRLMPELPQGIPPESLARLCAPRPWWKTLLERGGALTSCIDDAMPHASREELDGLHAEWSSAITAQLEFALRLENMNPSEALSVFNRLRETHRHLQAESGGPIFRAALYYGLIGQHPPAPVEQATATEAAGNRRLLVSSRKETEARLKLLTKSIEASNDREHWVAVRDLGLLATGRALEHDNARPVPVARLVVDRGSLASNLERARRAVPRAGEALDRLLTGFMPMMTASSLLAVAAAAVLRASPVMAAMLFLLATLGGLHLIDVAVTGPLALRHLPTRDFAEGFAQLWGFGGGLLWGPAVLFMAALVIARLASTRFAGGLNSLLRFPLRYAALGLFGLFAAILLAPISPALRTEILNFIAATAMALWIARYAPVIIHGASPWRIALFAAPILVGAILSGFLGSLSRVDPLGSLGIAALVTMILMVLLTRNWAVRSGLLLLLGFGLLGYARFIATGEDAGLIAHLPSHGAQRFLTALDSLHHGAPDVRLVRWLIASAQLPGETGAGWGWGNVPWNGLPGIGRAAALPTSAASDLSLLLAAGVGGVVYAFALMTVLALVLIRLVEQGFALAIGDEARLAQRFCACVGAIGLLTAFLRMTVNIAGTLQVLPLAGVPVAFLSHAPAANAFVLALSGLLLGASTRSYS